MKDSLFDADPPPAPLAERMRPRDLGELLGQDRAIGPGTPLRRLVEDDKLPSLILWGPPGSGKTSLARVLAGTGDAAYESLSAVLSGVKDVREVVERARERRRAGQGTLLFVDEIHRFNKAQQDAFLPRVEAGDIVLIGATTENPSFEVNAALLSRSKVYVLKGLGDDAMRTIVRRTLEDRERGLGSEGLSIDDDALTAIVRYANGDARVALNLLDMAAGALGSDPGVQNRTDRTPGSDPGRIALPLVADLAQNRALLYDKTGEEHYNLISALHKSMRNSDPDASVYWLARMVEAGEDPLYIARRLVRFASEDVGLADPQALGIAVAAKDAVHFIGMPEGNTALAQAVLYLATAPKSNAVYMAYNEAADAAKSDFAAPVPLHIRNAPTKLMKDLEYGKGYKYAHDEPDAIANMDCLPDNLKGREFYKPSEYGFEREIKKRLEWWKSKKR